MTAVFSPSRWLRDLGRTAWLIVGAILLLVGLVWLLGATMTIVGPVTVATIVAVVSMPVVDLLDKHMPRALAAALFLVGVVAVAVCILLLVLAGISDQRGAISQYLSSGIDHLQTWLHDAGVDKSSAAAAGGDVKSGAPNILSTLLHGVINGIRGLASFVFQLSLGALSLFFVLKDGPVMRRWMDRHLGVPQPVATVITGGIGRSLRGYFRGVTLVALFNGVVVTIGALLLHVPLPGTIGIVTFVTAYVPFIGAFVAGTFAVVIALGAKGATVALIMLVIVLLANGLLQNVVQPFAMGSALELNPLVVLVVTIGSGCLFGTIGLVLSAPLVSAAVHIQRDLRQMLEE
jgi:predicted PurR-regulated permease PerM